MEDRPMSATLERATLTAPDISCSHCVATIQKAVGGLAGVSKVAANEQTKQVQVEFDPQRVSLAQIEATMDEEGYPVQK
jgi:copper ion binding protein